MGTGEEITPVLSSKATLSTRVLSFSHSTRADVCVLSLCETSNIPSHPDQATSMQVYHGAGATQSPCFTSAVASPPPHPYLWGNQGAAFSIIKTEEMVADGKDSMSMKIPKGNPGNMGLIGGKSGQIRKEALRSGCDATSQSTESGSGGLSDASNEDPNRLASSEIKQKSFSQMLADVSAPENLTVPRPTLSSVSSQVPLGRMVVHEGVLHDQQPTQAQDEHELKRLRRKQSNRESARRSKLRKQAKCEELQAKVERMGDENHTLTDELNRLAKQCETLTSENNNIMEELAQTY